MEHFRPGCAASVTATTVELSVSCRNLLDMDVFSKSDPLCVLFCKDFGRDSWFEFGRTEVIDNNLNPDFVKKFVLSYFFEERQHLRFELYDVDSNSRNLKDHDFLGRIECTLGEIVSSGKFQKPLQGTQTQSNAGQIIIYSEEQSTCREEITLQFSGKKLDKKDWFGKSDPFLAFYKVNEDGSFTVCHRTEVVKNTLNPSWKPFTVPVRALCAGDYNRSILVKCNDWNLSGEEKLIGEFTTNLTELSAGPSQQTSFELINQHKKMKKKNKYQNSGFVGLMQVRIQQTHSFLDYVSAGTQLNCTIAIDFTASNGNPTQPNSLHYIHPHQPNQYARALQAVGEIIQDYDSDQLFPVLGFGARLPPDGRVSHEFFVNMSPNNPYCNGVQGVLEAYHRSLMQVQLYGPTNFAPVINHVARFAAGKRDGSEYFILLILTDGVITDMPQTKEAIVAASGLPLSIIIVGVGQADFEPMQELDGDADGPFGRLNSRGKYAERDIVQFVPFREFIKGNSAVDLQISQARLAKEVLEEIPDQFLGYMKANRIVPGSWPGAQTRPAPQTRPGPQTGPGPQTRPGPKTRPAPVPPGFSVPNEQPAGHGGSFSSYGEAPPPYPGI